MDLPWGFYLGWDWPWLVFFIVLGLSVALATVVKKPLVLWVLPGIVLYNGLLWDIPGGWSFLFRLLFWVIVLVAIATWLLPGPTRLARVPMYLMVALIVWCFVLWLLVMLGDLPGLDALWWILGFAALVGLVLLVFATKAGMAVLAVVVTLGLLNLSFGLMFDGEEREDDTPPADTCVTFKGKEDTEIQEVVPEGFKADETKDCTKIKVDDPGDNRPVACPERFEQNLDPNRRNRFDSSGFEGTPQAKRRQLVAALGHDYRYLDFVAEQLFKRPIVGASLVTDGRECLNEKGRTLHAKVEGALMASGIKTGLAPRDGFNTGMENDRAVVAKRRGVYGDRKATIYTLADGTKLIVLDRCGNMVLKSKPKGTPEGPTDNPPPPKEDKPPEDTGGCVEIPGNGVYDCVAKNPEDEPAEEGNVPDNVTGSNPGTGGTPASQPSAQPEEEYTPPPPPDSGSGGGGDNNPPPPQETSAPQPDDPEPSPTQDPCEVNPDWC